MKTKLTIMALLFLVAAYIDKPSDYVLLSQQEIQSFEEGCSTDIECCTFYDNCDEDFMNN